MTVPSAAADLAEIERALGLILEPGQVTELRALEVVTGPSRWPQIVSGYFDDPTKLAREASLIRQAKGIYFIPNPVNPALLARSMNKARVAGKEPTTGDADITGRRWILIDTDPVRPAGIAASDAEHEAALARAQSVKAALAEEGWPEPIVADSGNGSHLLYRIDLPADDGGLVQRCLATLAGRFDDSAVTIDQKVFNPARIWKLYGTIAGKGDADAAAIGRPHRLSKILSAPSSLAVVSREQLELLGGQQAVSETAGEVYCGDFDLPQWIAEHKLDVDGPKPWKGTGQRWVFRVCPWNAEHTDRSAWIAQQPSGAIAAGCAHNSCRGNDWRSLRAMIEGPRIVPAEPADVDLSGLLVKSHNPPAEVIESERPRIILPRPEVLPVEYYRVPGFIGHVMDLCLSTAPYPNVPLAFCGALAMQAFLAGRKVRDASDIRPNVYILGLADTGSGKDWPRRINTEIIKNIGLSKCLGQNFASGEGIQDALFATPSMLFQTDEIDSLLQAINRSLDARYEGILSTLLTVYTSSSSAIPMRRKAVQKAGQVPEDGWIEQPNLVLFGTATPKYYYAAISERLLTNGFFSRTLTIESQRDAGQESQIIDLPDAVLEAAMWWSEFLPGKGNLQEWHPVPAIVPCTDDARRLLNDCRRECDAEWNQAKSEEDIVGMAVWSRVNEQVRKLALLWSVSADYANPKIDGEAVRWAQEFVTRQTRVNLGLVRGRVADNPFHASCLKVLQILAGSPTLSLTHSELLRRMKMDAQTFQRIINTLMQQGDVEVVSMGRGIGYLLITQERSRVPGGVPAGEAESDS